jgi:NADH-quinone oxidoreductase subunit M
MILPWLILVPVGGGLLAWILSRLDDGWARWVSLTALILQLGLALAVILPQNEGFAVAGAEAVMSEYVRPWIPQLGIDIRLVVDGLSAPFVLLTSLLGIMSVATSWRGIQDRVGFFHFQLLWIIAGLTGVFLALDLFLFYFFWELMLVPLYFIIGIWGHEDRIRAAIKFFIFTQAGGLLMLAGILGLYFLHGGQTGNYTFDYFQLAMTSVPRGLAMGLMLSFFAAFAVKLPMVPLHTWLPDAHSQAPTAGSVVLAGLVLKAGAYGFLRLIFPLFPEAATRIAVIAMGFAVAGIIYGAVQTFGQTNLKRMVAYTSVSHMGFVLLGAFAFNQLSLQGAIIVVLSHGISTGSLFMLVGNLEERIHSRELDRMGGLWSTIPQMGGFTLLFAMASLGLPGLGNFVGEFLVLFGTYQVNIPLAVLATIGLVVSTVYSVWLVQRTFFGPNTHDWELPDTTLREKMIMGVMTLVILWLGLYPQTVFRTTTPAINALQDLAGRVEISATTQQDDTGERVTVEQVAGIELGGQEGGGR